jgi:hypothetical protein
MRSKSQVRRSPATTPPPVRLPRESHAAQSLRGQPGLPANAAAAPFLLRSNARFKSLQIRNADATA